MPGLNDISEKSFKQGDIVMYLQLLPCDTHVTNKQAKQPTVIQPRSKVYSLFSSQVKLFQVEICIYTLILFCFCLVTMRHKTKTEKAAGNEITKRYSIA